MLFRLCWLIILQRRLNRIGTIILKTERKKTEKWFNNAIRKFAIKLLEHYDKIDEAERTKMMDNLKKLID